MKEIKKSAKIILAVYGIFFTYLMNEGSYWTLMAHNVGFLLGIGVYVGIYYLYFRKKELGNVEK